MNKALATEKWHFVRGISCWFGTSFCIQCRVKKVFLNKDAIELVLMPMDSIYLCVYFLASKQSHKFK